jgi:PAS domain S-box-containing protein
VTTFSETEQFSRALRRAIYWPVGVLLVAALLLILVTVALFNEVSWSNHSYTVLADIRTCENEIIRGQDSVRAYLLTGDDSFARAYQAHRDHAYADLARLRQLVADKPEQVHNADDIVRAVQAWAAHADIMIAHHTPQMPANPDWVKLGTTLEESISADFEHFAQVETGLRDARLGHVRQMKVVLAGAGATLAALLVLTIVYQVRRQMLDLAAAYRTVLETVEQRQSALRRSEEDLEVQKERLHVTLTSIGDGVIVTDPAGRVVLMNHEAERLTGWTLADALHHPLGNVFKIVNEETRGPVQDPVTKVLVEKKVIGLANHTVLISRLAQECPIEDSAAPVIDGKGEIIGVVLVFHDATNARLAQKSLKAHSAELEKTVAERTLTLQQTISELQAFSYSVSHDLRAPLRAMQGFSDAVMEDYADKLDETGRGYLERIKSGSARLDRLITDLLSYTRISRDDAPLEPLDLDRITREIVDADTRFQAPAASIQIEGPLPKALGRESSIHQVISNLLGNAVKFVPEGATPHIRIWGETCGPRVRLWIEDKGLGIPPGEQEKIFDMFVQLNDPAKYGGTGIGLAIVKKAMQIMRGSVGVESAVGSGSRFWLELGKA